MCMCALCKQYNGTKYRIYIIYTQQSRKHNIRGNNFKYTNVIARQVDLQMANKL